MAEVRPDYWERVDQWCAERKSSIRVQFGMTVAAALVVGLGFLLAASVPTVGGVPLWLCVLLFAAILVGSVAHGWVLLLETLL